MIKPTAYTSSEGGPWLPWDAEIADIDVDESVLKQAKKWAVDGGRYGKETYIGNIRVHSIAFGDINSKSFKRWDCVSGWTNAENS